MVTISSGSRTSSVYHMAGAWVPGHGNSMVRVLATLVRNPGFDSQKLLDTSCI